MSGSILAALDLDLFLLIIARLAHVLSLTSQCITFQSPICSSVYPSITQHSLWSITTNSHSHIDIGIRNNGVLHGFMGGRTFEDCMSSICYVHGCIALSMRLVVKDFKFILLFK